MMFQDNENYDFYIYVSNNMYVYNLSENYFLFKK